MKLKTASVGLTALVWLGGCSTPPPAVQASAKETDAWMATLQAELADYRRDMDAADKVLLDAIKEANGLAIKLDQGHAEQLRVARAAGDKRTLELFDSLKLVVDGAAKDPGELEQKLKEIDERISALLAPYPATDASFTEARSAVRKLGQPLPHSVQFAELKALFNQVKEETEATRKALKAAAAASAAPTATP
jgi:hypothetical protein